MFSPKRALSRIASDSLLHAPQRLPPLQYSTPLFLYKLSVNRSGGDRFGMSVSQGLGADPQGAFGERYRLAQVALLLIKDGQIMQRLSYLRMVLTEVLFPKSERALK